MANKSLIIGLILTAHAGQISAIEAAEATSPAHDCATDTPRTTPIARRPHDWCLTTQLAEDGRPLTPKTITPTSPVLTSHFPPDDGSGWHCYDPVPHGTTFAATLLAGEKRTRHFYIERFRADSLAAALVVTHRSGTRTAVVYYDELAQDAAAKTTLTALEQLHTAATSIERGPISQRNLVIALPATAHSITRTPHSPAATASRIEMLTRAAGTKPVIKPYTLDTPTTTTQPAFQVQFNGHGAEWSGWEVTATGPQFERSAL